MSTPRSYGVLSLFCGLGGKTLGFLRARGAAGSRFHSVGAIDESELACRNFKLLTGETATPLDIGLMEGPDLAEFCERPDVVIMSPPCKGWSGCLPESMAKLERYQRLNRLALHSLKIVLDAWERPPALILFENVPRIPVEPPVEKIAEVYPGADDPIPVRRVDVERCAHLLRAFLRLGGVGEPTRELILRLEQSLRVASKEIR